MGPVPGSLVATASGLLSAQPPAREVAGRLTALLSVG